MEIISNKRNERIGLIITLAVSSFIFPIIVVFFVIDNILLSVDYICGKTKR